MTLFLCPLEFESETLKGFIESKWPLEALEWDLKGHPRSLYKVEGKDILLSFAALGRPYGELLNLLAEQNKTLKNIICFGGAGALTQDIEIGDLILNVDYADPLEIKKDPSIVIGKIKTVEQPLASIEAATLVQGLFGAIAVAMEGSWGAEKCPQNINFCELRVITDHCEKLSKGLYKQRYKTALSLAWKTLAKHL